jgi:hypothetical protein
MSSSADNRDFQGGSGTFPAFWRAAGVPVIEARDPSPFRLA